MTKVKKLGKVKDKIVRGLTYAISLFMFFVWLAFLILLPIAASILLSRCIVGWV